MRLGRKPIGAVGFRFGNPRSPGLIAHWKLDYGSDTTAIDSAGAYNVTLMNGPAWTDGKRNCLGNAG